MSALQKSEAETRARKWQPNPTAAAPGAPPPTRFMQGEGDDVPDLCKHQTSLPPNAE